MLPPHRRDIGVVFQSYALFPHMDVAGNIAFGLRQEGMDRGRITARVGEMLALVQMSGYEARRPHQLSGGQRQRVALARALAKMPKLLLLDEPLAALDRKLRAETRLELIGIQQRVGTAFLVVTHDQEEALSMASRVAVMNRGRLVQTGSPAEIYEQPNSRFVADFVGEVNLFEGEICAEANRLALRVTSFDRPIPLPEGRVASAGARASLALRPEKLRLLREPPIEFSVPARVASIGYLGGISVLHLDAGPAGLKAHLPSSAASGFAQGMAVWVSWSTDEAVLITQ